MQIKKFKKGDQVFITSGRDKGMTGEILKLLPKKGTVIVKGVALYKRHRKQDANNSGSIVTKERAIPLSKVMMIEGGKPIRVGLKRGKDGTHRISKKTKKEL